MRLYYPKVGTELTTAQIPFPDIFGVNLITENNGIEITLEEDIYQMGRRLDITFVSEKYNQFIPVTTLERGTKLYLYDIKGNFSGVFTIYQKSISKYYDYYICYDKGFNLPNIVDSYYTEQQGETPSRFIQDVCNEIDYSISRNDWSGLSSLVKLEENYENLSFIEMFNQINEFIYTKGSVAVPLEHYLQVDNYGDLQIINKSTRIVKSYYKENTQYATEKITENIGDNFLKTTSYQYIKNSIRTYYIDDPFQENQNESEILEQQRVYNSSLVNIFGRLQDFKRYDFKSGVDLTSQANNDLEIAIIPDINIRFDNIGNINVRTYDLLNFDYPELDFEGVHEVINVTHNYKNGVLMGSFRVKPL